VLDVVEGAKARQGMHVSDMARRARMSKRALVKIRKLQTRPSLRSLLAIAASVGVGIKLTAAESVNSSDGGRVDGEREHGASAA
jgi:transcriptional regulator with XRE-family HTH domain